MFRRQQSSGGESESSRDRSGLRKSMVVEHQSAMVLASYSNKAPAPATPDTYNRAPLPAITNSSSSSSSSSDVLVGIKKFAMEDANRLLKQTDLQWNYYSNSKSYSWV